MYLYKKIKDEIFDTSVQEDIKRYATHMWQELSYYLKNYNVKIPKFKIEIALNQNKEIKHLQTYFPNLTGKDKAKVKDDIVKDNITKKFKDFINNNFTQKQTQINEFIALTIYENKVFVQSFLKDNPINFALSTQPKNKQTNLYQGTNFFLNQKPFFNKHKKALIEISNHLNDFDDIIILPQDELIQNCSKKSQHDYFDYKIKINELKNISKNTQKFFDHIENNFIEREEFIKYNMLSLNFSIGIRKTKNISTFYFLEVFQNKLYELDPTLFIE